MSLTKDSWNSWGRWLKRSFYVFKKFLHGFRYGDARSAGEIVAAAQVGGDGSGGDVQDTFLIRREFQGHFADCGMTVMVKAFSDGIDARLPSQLFVLYLAPLAAIIIFF